MSRSDRVGTVSKVMGAPDERTLPHHPLADGVAAQASPESARQASPAITR